MIKVPYIMNSSQGLDMLHILFGRFTNIVTTVKVLILVLILDFGEFPGKQPPSNTPPFVYR